MEGKNPVCKRPQSKCWPSLVCLWLCAGQWQPMSSPECLWHTGMGQWWNGEIIFISNLHEEHHRFKTHWCLHLRAQIGLANRDRPSSAPTSAGSHEDLCLLQIGGICCNSIEISNLPATQTLKVSFPHQTLSWYITLIILAMHSKKTGILRLTLCQSVC